MHDAISRYENSDSVKVEQGTSEEELGMELDLVIA